MKSLCNRYRGSYISYILTYFFYYFSMAVFSSVLAVYLAGQGKSAQELSFIMSAAGLFSILLLPVTGWLLDKTLRPRLISGVLLLSAGMLGLVFSASHSVWVLFLLDGLIMSAINSITPICERMAASSRYRYGSIRVLGTFGYACGAQAAGFAMEHIAPSFIFVMLLISAVLSTVGFAGTQGFSGRQDHVPERSKASVSRLSFLRDRNFLLFLLCAFLFAGSSGANNIYSPVLLTGLGLPSGTVGTVLFFSTLVEIPLILWSHKFMDRLSGKLLFGLSFGMMLLQFLCYGFFRSPLPTVIAMLLLKATASTMFMMVSLKIVRNIVDGSSTSTALSVVNAVNALSGILFLNVGGAVADALSMQAYYLVLAAAALVGLLLCLLLKIGNTQRVFSA